MCTVVHLEPEDFARELVHNPKNVYARTYVLNFSTQSFFGKYFKQHTGTSPSRYKRKG